MNLNMPETKNKKIRPPELKIGFRLLLYCFTVISSVFSLMETVRSRLGDPADTAVFAAAACGMMFSGYYLYYDLTVGIKKTVRDARARYALAAAFSVARNTGCVLFYFECDAFWNRAVWMEDIRYGD